MPAEPAVTYLRVHRAQRAANDRVGMSASPVTTSHAKRSANASGAPFRSNPASKWARNEPPNRRGEGSKWPLQAAYVQFLVKSFGTIGRGEANLPESSNCALQR